MVEQIERFIVVYPGGDWVMAETMFGLEQIKRNYLGASSIYQLDFPRSDHPRIVRVGPEISAPPWETNGQAQEEAQEPAEKPKYTKGQVEMALNVSALHHASVTDSGRALARKAEDILKWYFNSNVLAD